MTNSIQIEHSTASRIGELSFYVQYELDTNNIH